MSTTAPAPAAAMSARSRGPGRTFLISRILTPLLLTGLAVWQISRGGDALPAWVENMSLRFQVDAMLLLRVMIGCELGAAVVMLVFGQAARVTALAALAATCFVGMAEMAAMGVGPGLVWRVGLLVAAGGLLLLLLGGTREGASGPAFSVPQFLAGLTGVGAAAAVAGAVPLAAPTHPVGITPSRAVHELVRDVAGMHARNNYIVMNAADWVNQRFRDLEWAIFLPEEMLADLDRGTKLVVFYTPTSDLSMQVFDEYVRRAAPMKAYAVRVPPRPDPGVVIPPPVPLPCPNCVLVAFPLGPLWVSRLPILLRIEDGLITCAAELNHDLDYELCTEPAS
jgi:hypothetical protein